MSEVLKHNLFADWWNQINELEKQPGISQACANDVVYLRTRMRHTPELEAELIRLHKAGTPPNVMEFGTGIVNLVKTIKITDIKVP